MSNPIPVPTLQHTANQAANEAIPTHLLVQAAEEFREWLAVRMPGAGVYMCGGLALAVHGNGRVTQDVDLAVDLTSTHRPHTGRPYDTNALKQLAASDPGRFIVGPKIYWVMYPDAQGRRIPIQIDFVDAQLFWYPFDPSKMMVLAPRLTIPIMSIPTLLVSKMRSAIERSQPNPLERFQKQRNDISDFVFALVRCEGTHEVLTDAQIRVLSPSGQEPHVIPIIRAFFELWAYSRAHRPLNYREMWHALIQRSQLPASYALACV